MPKSWQCKICHENISELGAYVKVAVSWYEHLSCHDSVQMSFAQNQGRQQVYDEQAAKLKAEQEAVKIKKMAEENARLERERVKTLTVQAQEQIKREQQGVAQDRFSLLEIDPEDAVRIAKERQDQAEVIKERQASDAAESERRKKGAGVAPEEEADAGKEALKRGVRPLEIK